MSRSSRCTGRSRWSFGTYLLLGIVFPVLTHQRAWIRAGASLAFSAAALVVPSQLLVFRWLFLFALGILAFYYRLGRVRAVWYLAAVFSATVGTFLTIGLAPALVGAGTSMLVAFTDLRSAPLLFLGEISYSLYLIHMPVAGRVINLGQRLRLGEVGTVVLTLLALVVAVTSAYAFYWFIERPARTWAERITYRPASPGRMSARQAVRGASTL